MVSKNRKDKLSKKEEIFQSQLNDEIKELEETLGKIDKDKKYEDFIDLPISNKTKRALNKNSLITLTDIQRDTLIYSLKGIDVMGTAKTGSGKTLAFIIPILELLYKKRWSKIDGLGALVITPTRELAYQIFNVLQRIGKFHDFSAGLVIGGKFMKKEAEVIRTTNIIICTPGRLLHHMDETWNFNADNIQLLVLDEADRMLEMGFEETMINILQNIPEIHRQVLLFSATRTKNLDSLIKLSLKNPVDISSHELSALMTPDKLKQYYMDVKVEEKIHILWNFIKIHVNSKILIFVQTCKQARFIFDVFSHMQPGIPLLVLHGAKKQLQRVEIYNRFLRDKRSCLIATDLASRGLDFPSVEWIVQMDCPFDIETYIHRVGRTARKDLSGQSLLLATNSEMKYYSSIFQEKRIPITKMESKKFHKFSIENKLQVICARDQTFQQNARSAFVAYFKSLYLSGKKEIFDIDSINKDEYAQSLGLVTTPRLRFLKKMENSQFSVEIDQDDDDEVEVLIKKVSNRSTDFEDNDDVEEDLKLMNEEKIKRNQKSKSKKKIISNLLKKESNEQTTNHIHFTEDYEMEEEELNDDEISDILTIDNRLERMKEQDKIDKETYRKLLKDKHKEKKIKEKDKNKETKDDEKNQKFNVSLNMDNDDNSDVTDNSDEDFIENKNKRKIRKDGNEFDSDSQSDNKEILETNLDSDEDRRTKRKRSLNEQDVGKEDEMKKTMKFSLEQLEAEALKNLSG
ncbi:hypothetical protein SNEBB_002235 [Seison nebaliae]|nr:hypothetical protein SNEBB_002235 [Seison nebaliae]